MSILAVPMIYEEVKAGNQGACSNSLEGEQRSIKLNSSSQHETAISGNGPKKLWIGDPDDVLLQHQAKNFQARYRRNVNPSQMIQDSPILPFSNKMFDWGNEVRGE